MSEFKKYMHIEKLGTDEVDTILEGKCSLFYKIDGTNSCIWLGNDDMLHFGSRNIEIDYEKDNRNFVKSMLANSDLHNEIKTFLKKYPSYIIYGEWLVPHTLRRYKEDAWNKFYIFDIYDTSINKYLSYNIYTSLLDNFIPHATYIPRMVELEKPTIAEVKKYLDETGAWLISSGLGEGVVIKNYDFINKYGRCTFAKILTEDFYQTKQTHRSENHEMAIEHPIEHAIANMITLEHVLKEKSKIEENYGTGWSDRYIAELLGRVFNEFIRDNMSIILKKFHNPTIDFKVLQKMSNDIVKKILRDLNG